MPDRKYGPQKVYRSDTLWSPLYDSQGISTGPSNAQMQASLGLSATIEATAARQATLESTLRAESFLGVVESDIAAQLTASLGLSADIAANFGNGLVSVVTSLGLSSEITGTVENHASAAISLGIGLVGPDDGTTMVRVVVLGTATASLGIGLDATVSDEVQATLAAQQAGNTLVASGGLSRYVTMVFRRATGEAPGITAYRFAFWDVPLPDMLGEPAQVGTGTIDENGESVLPLPGSTLPIGGVGYITLSDTDGNPEHNWKQHSGPVRVN